MWVRISFMHLGQWEDSWASAWQLVTFVFSTTCRWRWRIHRGMSLNVHSWVSANISVPFPSKTPRLQTECATVSDIIFNTKTRECFSETRIILDAVWSFSRIPPVTSWWRFDVAMVTVICPSDLTYTFLSNIEPRIGDKTCTVWIVKCKLITNVILLLTIKHPATKLAFHVNCHKISSINKALTFFFRRLVIYSINICQKYNSFWTKHFY